jgi:hypothetical protein
VWVRHGSGVGSGVGIGVGSGVEVARDAGEHWQRAEEVTHPATIAACTDPLPLTRPCEEAAPRDSESPAESISEITARSGASNTTTKSESHPHLDNTLTEAKWPKLSAFSVFWAADALGRSLTCWMGE